MKKLSTLLFFFFLVGIASAQNGVWQTQNPNYPPDDNLFGLLVSIVNENVAWTAAEAGDCSVAPWAFGLTQNDFARTTNGGQTWTSGTYPTSGVSITTDLFALDSNVAWLTVIDFVEGNKLLKTTDGGQTWIPQNINVTVYIDFVYFFGSGVGVVVGDPDSLGFEIFWTAVGGASWQRVDPATLPPILPGEFTFPFHAVEGSNVWFVTQYGRVFHSPSKGATWEVWPAPNVPLAGFPDYIACHDNTCLVSFGDYSDTITHINKFQLFRTSNKGVTWEDITPADNNNNYALTGMQFVPNTGTLIGAFTHHNVNGPFETRISHDDGTTWQPIDEGTKVLTLFFYDSTTGYGTHLNNTGGPTEIYRYVGPPLISGLFERHPLDATISASPNPTTGIVRVHVQGEIPDDYMLTVSDALGRVIHRKMIDNQSSFEQTIDLSGVPAGVYWVSLSNGVGSTCAKVVKQ